MKKLVAFLIIVLLFGGVSLTLRGPIALSQSNSWLMFQGNSLRDGSSNFSLVLPLKELWKLSMGEENTENWIYSSPVCENGKVYVGDLKGYLIQLMQKREK